MKDMEFKSQIATTREQSEQLLALGLKPETADMYWCEDSLLVTDWSQQKAFVDYPPEDKTDEFYPAWSLSRLLEMIPKFIYPSLAIEVSPPYISYWNTFEKRFEISYGSGNIYENAIFIISWLIKNNHFNTEYLK